MLQEHRSRPLWARELKQREGRYEHGYLQSRPLWARELKLGGMGLKELASVAPLVGA